MSLNEKENLMIDKQLMKIIGIYQILSPHSLKMFGSNVALKYIVMIQTLVYVFMVFVFVLNILYCLDNVNKVMNYFVLVVACANAIFKLYSIFRHSEKLWSCIQLMPIKYFSYKQHSRLILETGRTKSKSLATLFVIWWMVFCSIWIILPLFNYIQENKMENKNLSNYQDNVLNLVFPVSVEFYNEHFISYYVLESLLTAMYSQSMLMFDVITISMCIMFSYQLKTIANSYRTFNIAAHDGFIDEREEKSNLIIHEFKILIRDQQKVISNMRNTYKILRPVILFQILANSLFTILLSSLTIMNYVNGIPLMSEVNVKYMAAVFTYILQLYLICYLFDDVDEQKNSINFAMYSIDWTEKSINFKKLILYAMRMNNAENLKLQITINKKVNFELFMNIMQTTYSILSVLVNKYEKLV